MGKVQMVEIKEDLQVANMIAQDGVGAGRDRLCRGSLRRALQAVACVLRSAKTDMWIVLAGVTLERVTPTLNTWYFTVPSRAGFVRNNRLILKIRVLSGHAKVPVTRIREPA